MSKESENTTAFLNEILQRTRPEDISKVLEEYADKLLPEAGAFSVYMRALIKKNGLTQQEVFLRAFIPERYGYKLISGEKITQRRDVLIRIFLAAGFTIGEAQHALRLYGMPELYSRMNRDAVLMIALNSGMTDPFEVDELLEKHGMEPLSPCGSEP